MSSYKESEEEFKSKKGEESANLADEMSPEVSHINESPQKRINMTMSIQKKTSPNNECRKETHEDFIHNHQSPADESMRYLGIEDQMSKIEHTNPIEDKSSFQIEFDPIPNEESKQMSITMQSQSLADFENLFQMKEEYIFVFSGFNDRFLTSVEVFDVTRGIWREFPQLCSHKTKFHAINSGESILLLGGKDEFGVQTDEVEEFLFKEMKSLPGDWKLPQSMSGFAICPVKKGIYAVAGGNTGS